MSKHTSKLTTLIAAAALLALPAAASAKRPNEQAKLPGICKQALKPASSQQASGDQGPQGKRYRGKGKIERVARRGRDKFTAGQQGMLADACSALRNSLTEANQQLDAARAAALKSSVAAETVRSAARASADALPADQQEAAREAADQAYKASLARVHADLKAARAQFRAAAKQALKTFQAQLKQLKHSSTDVSGGDNTTPPDATSPSSGGIAPAADDQTAT